MKYIFLFVALSFCNTNASAQYYKTHQPDTLRWFVGKWVDNKTFKIDSTIYGKGGGSGTVTVKDGAFDISTPEKEAFEKNMNDALKTLEDNENEISKTIKETQGIYQFNLADRSIKELEKVKEDVKEIIEDKNTPPPVKPSDAGDQAFENDLTSMCNSIKPEYLRIINFYKAHKSEKNPHFDLPPPPVADYFNCWGCDTAKMADFERLSHQYRDDFFKDMRKDVNLLLTMMGKMEGYGLGSHPEYFGGTNETAKNAFDSTKSHIGPCAYISYYDMCKALNFYQERAVQMLSQLWNDNINNYGAYKVVLNLCMASYQTRVAMGLVHMDADFKEYLIQQKKWAKPIEGLYDSLTMLLFEKKDYSLMRTIPAMMGLYQSIIMFLDVRDSQTGAILFDMDGYVPKHNIQELIGFPNFELTVELDTKIGEKGSYTIAHLKSKSKVIVELDDKECVKFSLANKEEDKIKADIITNEAISPSPHGIYVGTKTYTSQSPIFKIRFCPMEGVPTGDSIYLSTFVPLAPDKGNWNVQGKLAPLGINQADRLFINIDELKNDAQNIKPEADQKQLDDIKKNSLEMADKIKAMQAAGNLDPMKMAEMVKQMMSNSTAVVETQTSELMRIRLPLKVTNKDKILINQRFDAKAINPQISQPIVYAYLTIKLVHKPTYSNDYGE